MPLVPMLDGIIARVAERLHVHDVWRNGLNMVHFLLQSSVFDHLRSWNPAGGAL